MSLVRGIPEQGQLVNVRSRRFVVMDVRKSSLPTNPILNGVKKPQHLVTLSSVEDDALGEELSLPPVSKMPAPIQITLNPEEDRTLIELRVAQTVPQRTRDRAHVLRLNAQGWTVPAIAEIFKCHEHTVRATIQRWQERGLGGLWEAPGRGTKRKWQNADMQYLEKCLEQEQRTYNSAQLAAKLEQERQVSLSADRIRRILQKRGSDGNAPAGASEVNKTWSKNNSNRQTWQR